MNTHRFGKVVMDPEVEGRRPDDYVEIPLDLSTAMETAVRDGDKNQLEALYAQIPMGANLVHVITRQGNTLLHIAADLGFLKCAQFLVETAGMSPTLSLPDGTQPVHCSALHGHASTLQYFIEKGANKEAKNNIGETPLHLLAKGPIQESYEEDKTPLYANCIAKLVVLGANVNAKDNADRTPLHVAAKTGCVPIAKALLIAGADKNIKDTFGMTAADTAVENGNQKVEQLIKSKIPLKLSKGGSSSSSSSSKDKDCIIC
eukprot:TRINITY_DN181_c4_g1_i1.p2 TRINITY_DN181_c4_g1~~TRINITY_DN181_c4_g1_i1.p2  ORF type:complete len:288 (-),score=119.48 TRINITY_DN181_c4_g1_i1:91-870(-)